MIAAAVEFNEAHPDAAKAILRATPLGRMGDCEQDVGRAVAASSATTCPT